MARQTGQAGKSAKPVRGAAQQAAAKPDDGHRAATAEGRAIVLFSDGTGNSSAKLFKTNVWRMYEAIDLGDSASDADQIVYYDEGVGTSGLRPIAALGAVFGVGLKRNALDLYRFLCRNYRDGDRIFAFGFSRGAFTIRVLIGLIEKEGLVTYEGEADLAHQAADAHRNYIKGRNPRFGPMRLIVPAWRFLVSRFLAAKRRIMRQRLYSPGQNRRPRVAFVGLWDTVAAYGGPITEIVRGFDDWIRPLTFKDRGLPPIVDRARHALALDDERDAFQPVLWHEPNDVDREQLQQVWFSGMHADVGGGYPDDSLAYVSLAWMMKEAQAAGLMLRPEKVRDVNRTANAFGPMHDSRSGVGAYYRYQPRTVGGYIEPPQPGTEALRDPETEDQGLKDCPWVDESVLCRIHAGTDGYAPITLPGHIRVVGRSSARNTLPRDLHAKLESTAERRDDQQEKLRNLVWGRRTLYFLTVAATVFLVALPVLAPEDAWCSDSRCYLGTVIGWARFALPGFAESWVLGLQRAASWTAGTAALIFILITWSAMLERRLRDRTRILWRESIAGDVTPRETRSVLRRVRTSRVYQKSLEILKWGILPSFFGIGMLLALIWIALIPVTQVRMLSDDDGTMSCRGPNQPAPSNWIDISKPCNRLPVRVVENRTYEVDLQVPRAWQDGGRDAEHLSISAWSNGPLGMLGAPYRRVVNAEYLQPLVVIHPKDDATLSGDGRAYFQALEVEQVDENRYRARFRAAREGALWMFVNDAVPPFFDIDYFYNGSDRTRNVGTACVSVAEVIGTKRTELTTCPHPGESAPPGRPAPR